MFLSAALVCGYASASDLSPMQRLAVTPKGQLQNPYADLASVADEGLRIYRSLDCNGCHGGGGVVVWQRP